MPAPADNTYAMKFPTPEDRKALCAAYIAHIQSGLSDECFPECDPQTLRKYVEQFPADFDTGKMAEARRRRQYFWEKMGLDGTMGQIKGFNSKSWQFNMGNRFGWREKREDTVKVKKDGAAELARRLFDEDEDEEDTTIDDFDSPGPAPAAPEAEVAGHEAQTVPEDEQDAPAVSDVV